MSRMLASVKQQICKEIESLSKVQVAEIKQINKKLQAVQTQVQEIQDILQVSGHFVGNNAGSKAAKTTLGAWERKLDEFTPHMKLIFSNETFARVLSFNVPVMVMKMCNDAESSGGSDPLSGSSKAFATLMFSLQPYQPRSKYCDGIGKLHNDFKFTAICNVLFNVQKKSFGLFRTAPSSEEYVNDEGGGVNQNSPAAITRPTWLKPEYVKTHHVMAAQSFLEKRKQAKKERVKDTPTTSDVARTGAIEVYRAFGGHLHDGREKVKISFFQDVGYLMVNWSNFTTDVDQSSLKMYLTEEERRDRAHTFSPERIVETNVCAIGSDSTIVDTTNKQLLNDLFADWTEIVLVAEHEVFVVAGSGAQRKHSGGTKHQVHRLISLIEVACNFCVGFTQVKSIEAFMRSHRNALRCVMIFAVLFRKFAQSFLDQSDFESDEIPEPYSVKGGICNMDQITPVYGTKKALLEIRCLRMNQKEFEQLNQPLAAVSGHDVAEDGSEGREDGEEIQASAKMGIAAL